MFTIKAPTTIHNHFDFQLINAEGQVVQTAYAENLVTDLFWRRWFTYNQQSYQGTYIGAIAIGTGTTPPESSDTQLTRRLAMADASLTSYDFNEPATLVFTATFAASENIVGDIAEVGLLTNTINYVANNYLLTHALLQDAEGNPIIIHKSDTDVLIVTATIYISITLPNYVIRYDYASRLNPLLQSLIKSGKFFKSPIGGPMGYTSGYTFFGMTLSKGTNVHFKNTPTYLSSYPTQVSRANFPTTAWGAYFHTANKASTMESQDIQLISGNYEERSLTLKKQRLLADSGFNDFMFTRILFAGIGYIELPNHEIFPPYIETLDVGIGDGITDTFICPIPIFRPNTDKIYIDDVLQVRDVDYVLDPNGNSKQCISIMSCNDPCQVYGKTVNYTSERLFQLINMPDDSNWASAVLKNPYATSLVPLIFEYEEPITLNTCYLYALANNVTNNLSTNIYFEYSMDGENYTTLFEVLNYNSNLKSSTQNLIPGGPIFKFDTVIAKYIRLRVEKNTSAYGEVDYISPMLGDPWYHASETYKRNISWFGYCDEGIKFTTPPTEGANIRIEAAVEYPFKHADNVIDFGCKILL